MSAIAQDFGYFFNSNNSDRTYNAESFETWLKPFFLSGVFEGDLQVTAQDDPDMSVQVASGFANLNGKPAYWGGTNTLVLSTASGVYNRIDTIVLRRDNTNRQISIEVVTGTASGTPQPTAPTRNSDIYELVLAQVYVGVGVTQITAANITDKRTDTTVCGYVSATVDQVDFNQFKTQFDGWVADFEDAQAEWEEDTRQDFSDWFDAIKGQLDEDAAGHLQLEIDDINENAVFKTDLVNGFAETGTGKALDARAGKTLEDSEAAMRAGVAIVAEGDTHAAVASGQYVYVHGHGTLAEGMYTASSAIAANAALSSSNLTAVSSGALNGLKASVDTLNSNLSNKVNTSAVVNNLTTTTSGYVLDARQGKVLSDAAVKRATYLMNTGTANLLTLEQNSTYLLFATSNAIKGVWIAQTGLTSGTVTNIVSASGLSLQMAGSSSRVLQYTNNTTYEQTLGVVKLATT